MAEYLVQGESITAVADAIREKGGTTAPLSFPDGMANAVRGIPSGGTDISLGLTAATVGQTIKVKAVDTEGKPTEWEAVDFPSGSGWKEIDSTELDSTVQNVFFTEDADGNPFSVDAYSELVVFLKLTLGETFSSQPNFFLSHFEGSKHTSIATIFHTNLVLKTGGDNIVFANAKIIPKGVASLSYFQPHGTSYAWQNTVQNSFIAALTEAQLSSINGFVLGGLNGLVSGEFYVYGRVK